VSNVDEMIDLIEGHILGIHALWSAVDAVPVEHLQGNKVERVIQQLRSEMKQLQDRIDSLICMADAELSPQARVERNMTVMLIQRGIDRSLDLLLHIKLLRSGQSGLHVHRPEGGI
jgi:pantothenate kinase-related protein Tda10